jgi:hypothetical protein
MMNTHNIPVPQQYILVDYTQNYDQDTGNDMIRRGDEVRPYNGRWAKPEEILTWHLKSTLGLPTYGTCEYCFASGPLESMCTFCGSGHHRCMKYQGRILDSEYISSHMSQEHQRARANRMHNWVRVDFVDLNEYMVNTVMQRKYDYIENEAEKNRLALQGKVDFLELFADIEF